MLLYVALGVLSSFTPIGAVVVLSSDSTVPSAPAAATSSILFLEDSLSQTGESLGFSGSRFSSFSTASAKNVSAASSIFVSSETVVLLPVPSSFDNSRTTIAPTRTRNSVPSITAQDSVTPAPSAMPSAQAGLQDEAQDASGAASKYSRRPTKKNARAAKKNIEDALAGEYPQH